MKRWLARVVALIAAAALAYVIAVLLRSSYCTLTGQLQVWMLSFLCLLGGTVFVMERRFGASGLRAAALAALTVFLMLLVSSLSVANLFGAVTRSRQIASRSDLRAMADYLEAERARNGAYPAVSSVTELNSLAGRSFPEFDRWGTRILVISEPSRSVVVSFGECGRPEQLDPWAYLPGPTHDTRADIVFLNGMAWRYPEGIQE